jgi:hypothetical protein
MLFPIISSSSAFRDIGGYARFSRNIINEAGVQVLPETNIQLGYLLGSLHENMIYPGNQMSKTAFDRLILSLVQSLER